MQYLEQTIIDELSNPNLTTEERCIKHIDQYHQEVEILGQLKRKYCQKEKKAPNLAHLNFLVRDEAENLRRYQNQLASRLGHLNDCKERVKHLSDLLGWLLPLPKTAIKISATKTDSISFYIVYYDPNSEELSLTFQEAIILSRELGLSDKKELKHSGTVSNEPSVLLIIE